MEELHTPKILLFLLIAVFIVALVFSIIVYVIERRKNRNYRKYPHDVKKPDLSSNLTDEDREFIKQYYNSQP